MPATDSFPWRCNNCGSVNDGGQLTCTLCGGPYTSGDPPGPLPELAHRPGKGRILRRLFLLGLIVILSAGGLVFAYLSYTPFRLLQTFQMLNMISSLAWSPDSRVFAAVTCGQYVGVDVAMVNVWRASDGRQLFPYGYQYDHDPSGCSRLAWSPDGSSLAMAWDDGTVNIWRVANDYSSWHEQSPFHLHVQYSVGGLTGLAWSADGKHLVMSYRDGQLHVWDTVAGHALPPVQAPGVAPQMSSILALSPDGTQAIVRSQQTSGKDGTYATWDLTTGKVTLLPSQDLLQAHEELPDPVWSPDGKALAVMSDCRTCWRRTVLTWQWDKQGNSWTFVRSMDVGTPNRWISALTWSANSKLLATADSSPGVIRMWSASTGALLGPFRLPWYDPPMSKDEARDTRYITGLAWSPNGTYLLAANAEEQVMLWLVL